MELSDQLAVDLKSEYKAQKEIFNILKEQYKEKVVKLESQLKDAKSENEPSSSAWSTYSLFEILYNPIKKRRLVLCLNFKVNHSMCSLYAPFFKILGYAAAGR